MTTSRRPRRPNADPKRVARVLAYLNRRRERHTEERLAEAWASFPDELLPTDFEKVLSGEAPQSLVRALFGQWVDAIARAPIPPKRDDNNPKEHAITPAEHAFWLKALRSVAERADPGTALRLKIGHNRPRREAHILAARDVWWLVHRKDMRPGTAIALVAERRHLSKQDIRNACSEHRADLDVLFAR